MAKSDGRKDESDVELHLHQVRLFACVKPMLEMFAKKTVMGMGDVFINCIHFRRKIQRALDAKKADGRLGKRDKSACILQTEQI